MTRKERFEKAGEIIKVLALWDIPFVDARMIIDSMRYIINAKGGEWYKEQMLAPAAQREDNSALYRSRVLHEPETEQ